VQAAAPERLRRHGIPVNSAFAGVATVRATARQLYTLSRMPAVRYVSAPPQLRPLNDEAAGLTGIRLLNNGRLNGTAYRGQGVTACIIDSGIDYTHLDFRELRDTTESRVRAIWDQTLTPQSDEQTPAARRDADFSGLTYGVEYPERTLEDELDGTPAGEVRQQDVSGHGSHVAGTFVGNSGADPNRRYTGMAPAADIVAVKTDFTGPGLLDGLRYCGEVAADAGQPVVVNLSLGTQAGPHDGTLPFEAAITDWVRSAEGRAVVAAAGNSGGSRIHTSGSIPAGERRSFRIEVPGTADQPGPDDLSVDVWLDGRPDASVTVTSPSGEAVTLGPGRDTTASTADGRIVLSNEAGRPVGDGDRSVRLTVDDADGTVPAGGTWTVTLTNASGAAVGYHGWLYDDGVGGGTATMVGGNGRYTVAAPATADGAIAVGAYVHRWRWCDVTGTCHRLGAPDRSDDVAAFSSVGPRRDGALKPELTAPGERMGSTYSDDRPPAPASGVLPGGRHRLLQGTSVSAPVGAGAAALLLQQNPTLSSGPLADLLTGAARSDHFTGETPNPTWGHGKLDAVGAMRALLGGTRPSRRAILRYDDWGATGARTITGGERFAVRFTPSFDGTTTGALLHPAATVDVDRALTLQVWTDDGTGRPGTPIGRPVTYPADSLMADTWNYVDVTPTGVALSAGGDYHLVVTVPPGDTLGVRTDVGAVGDRSTATTGAGWTSAAADWRLRPVVSTTDHLTAPPAPIADFSGRADGGEALLSWTLPDSVALSGFAVEHRAGPDGFRELAVVPAEAAAGDRTYRYRAAGLDPGPHTFRLRQVGPNGSVAYSRAVTLDLALPDRARVSAVRPNPVDETASVSFTVETAQRVEATLYDVLGRRVATLYDRSVPANDTQTLRVDPSRLAGSGIYFLRVQGETFSTVRKLSVVQ
jgi:hypothetical protein